MTFSTLVAFEPKNTPLTDFSPCWSFTDLRKFPLWPELWPVQRVSASSHTLGWPLKSGKVCRVLRHLPIFRHLPGCQGDYIQSKLRVLICVLLSYSAMLTGVIGQACVSSVMFGLFLSQQHSPLPVTSAGRLERWGLAGPVVGGRNPDFAVRHCVTCCDSNFLRLGLLPVQ